MSIVQDIKFSTMAYFSVYEACTDGFMVYGLWVSGLAGRLLFDGAWSADFNWLVCRSC